MKRRKLLTLTLLGLTLGAGFADEIPVASNFIRIDEDAKSASLQTAITSYRKDGVVVDLLGAIHIGDREYYEDLNKRFEAYEVLLFEMVGGENLVAGKIPAARPEGEAPDSQMAVLGDVFGMMTKALRLTGQKDVIDYSKRNFVHADLTLAEFAKLQGEKDESVFGFALASGIAAERANPGLQMDAGKVMAAMLSGNSDGLKLELMKTLGQGDDQLGTFAGQSVIIGDRNAKCLKVLDAELAKGRKKIGVFYGAAHFPDMEERLLKQGFVKTGQAWLTAWEAGKEF